MIKATFLNIPLNKFTLRNTCTRIIFENIQRNPNIEIEYDSTLLTKLENLYDQDYIDFQKSSINTTSNTVKFFREEYIESIFTRPGSF
jgi:hypothetical protein